MHFDYPKFIPSFGYLTKKIIDEYIKDCVKVESSDIYKIKSLVASNDSSDPLYFWQLYSILGRSRIQHLITIFYTKILNDSENPWFRDAFRKLGDLDYHVTGQTKFWVDVMGGGKCYKSEKILHFKHKHSSEIMTEKGANVWMKHMINSLYEVRLCEHPDKRIIPCISDFLNYFMTKYAREFDFNIYEVIVQSKL